MKKKVHFIIPTYQRPEMLNLLLSDIRREQNDYDIRIYIYDDASTVDYFINEPGLNIVYYKFPHNNGRTRWWKLVTKAYEDTRGSDADYFIFMVDDFRLIPGFIKKVIELWKAIDDEKKICLNLSTWNTGNKSWTGFQPVLKNFNGVKIWHSQWIDMCFISEWKFFSATAYRVKVSKNRWKKNKNRSSGVSSMMSMRLSRLYNLYQVTKSLISNDRHESMMNSIERIKHPNIVKFHAGSHEKYN